MNINFKSIECNIREFINNKDIIQGKAFLNTEYPKDSTQAYFLNKMTCENGTTVVFIKSIYSRDEKVIISYSEFLMCIDYNNKFIIHDGHYNIDFKSLEKELLEFKFYHSEELDIEIYNKYKEKTRELFDKNFEEFMKIDVYKDVYNKTLSESYKGIENDYLDNKTNYEMYIKDINTSRELEGLQEYINNPSMIDNLVNEYFKEVTEEKNNRWLQHANIMAYKKILEDIKSNPSERIKFIKNIKDSIEGAGKTLNVTTKEGNMSKVENNVCNNEEFRTCTGWNSIKLEDIKEITFGKKILYVAD